MFEICTLQSENAAILLRLRCFGMLSTRPSPVSYRDFVLLKDNSGPSLARKTLAGGKKGRCLSEIEMSRVGVACFSPTQWGQASLAGRERSK